MSAQSWVETTVPPGYDLVRFSREIDGEVIEVWCGCCGADRLVGPEPRSTKEEASRDMWRHWTAAVLRGRGDVRTEQPSGYLDSGGILWLDRETAGETDIVGYCNQAVLCGDAVMVGWDQGFIVRHHAEMNYYTARNAVDVDEAMALFAMAVFFSQGPVVVSRLRAKRAPIGAQKTLSTRRL